MAILHTFPGGTLVKLTNFSIAFGRSIGIVVRAPSRWTTLTFHTLISVRAHFVCGPIGAIGRTYLGCVSVASFGSGLAYTRFTRSLLAVLRRLACEIVVPLHAIRVTNLNGCPVTTAFSWRTTATLTCSVDTSL